MMMMMRRFLDLFKDPARAIGDAKREKDIWVTVGFLVLVSTLVSLVVLFIIGGRQLPLAELGMTSRVMSGMAVGCLLFVFFGGLFAGYLVKIVLKTLSSCGKKGGCGYFEGLTAITYALVAPSAGLLLAFILGSMVHEMFIGPFIGAMILAVTVVLGYATFFRALKELFGTDLITAFVGAAVLWLSSMVVIYYFGAVLGLSELISYSSSSMLPIV